MGRPVKTGLEYFPKDTDSFSDRKIRRLLKTFGAKGYLIYDFMRCEIYRDKGYFIVWDEDLAFDVADALSISTSLVKEVITFCGTVGLFDEELLTSERILTSKGIQKRYIKICKDAKRTNYEIDSRIDLLENSELISVSSEEIRINSEETPDNSALSTQSKVKESKEKKSKEEESIPPEIDNDFLDSIFEAEPSKLFIRYWRRNPSPQEIISVKELITQHGIEDVKNSFHKAMEQGSDKMTIAYVKGIFKNLLKERFDVEQKERKQSEMREASEDRKKDGLALNQKYKELWNRYRNIQNFLTPLEQERLVVLLNGKQYPQAETKIIGYEKEAGNEIKTKEGTVESLALSMKIV